MQEENQSFNDFVISNCPALLLCQYCVIVEIELLINDGKISWNRLQRKPDIKINPINFAPKIY